MAPDSPNSIGVIGTERSTESVAVTPETAAQLTPSNLTTRPVRSAVLGLPTINRSRMSKLRQKLNGALIAAQAKLMLKTPMFNMRPLKEDELFVELVKTQKVYLEHYVEPVTYNVDGDGQLVNTNGFGVFTATGVSGGKFTGPVRRAFYYTEAKARRRAREMDKKPYMYTAITETVRRKCNVCLAPATHVEYMDTSKDSDYRRYLCEEDAKRNVTPAMVFFNAQHSEPLPESEQ